MNFVLFPDNYVISLVLNFFFFLVFFSVYFPVVIAMSIPYLLTHLCCPFALCCHCYDCSFLFPYHILRPRLTNSIDRLLTVLPECPTPKRGFLCYMPRMASFFSLTDVSLIPA